MLYFCVDALVSAMLVACYLATLQLLVGFHRVSNASCMLSGNVAVFSQLIELCGREPSLTGRFRESFGTSPKHNI